MDSKTSRDRARQVEWRAYEPEVRDVVEREMPRSLLMADERRQTNLPAPWKAVVDQLAADVRNKVNAEPRALGASPEQEPASELAWQWSLACIRVSDVLEYLQRTIRRDIGLPEGVETLSSMALLDGALMQLQFELDHIGNPDGRADEEENRYRAFRALTILHPRFDDPQLKRFRALRIAEESVQQAVALDDASIEQRVARMRQHHVANRPDMPWDAKDEEHHRRWFRVELPMHRAVLARSDLAAVDPRFAELDALLVLEEFSAANAKSKGGKTDGGEGKTGPARALARLALTCGALAYVQAADETFDDAVERVRTNLLVSRSRIRAELRAFPRQTDHET